MPFPSARPSLAAPFSFMALAYATFWLLLITVAWCYAGYPMFIVWLARVRPRPWSPDPGHTDPAIAVVLAVRNEREQLRARLDNLLGQRYPAPVEIIVACNGSTDGTEELARAVAAGDPRVRVVVSPPARGKAGAVNAAVASTDADVVVFADARQSFAPDAVLQLARPFSDPEVGAVTGRLVVRPAEDGAVEGVRLYWGAETRLRMAESGSGSVVGATGAIYAVRRRLFQPIPPSLILDDVYVPLRIGMGGSRVVMNGDAVAFDRPAHDPALEYARKRRTMVGNIQLLRVVPGVLSPFANPLWFRFVSHKVLRVLSPFCFVALLLVSAVLPDPLSRAFFAVELALYAGGIVGLVTGLPVLGVPSAFVLVHAAVFAAALRWRQDASQLWAQSSQVPLAAREVSVVAGEAK